MNQSRPAILLDLPAAGLWYDEIKKEDWSWHREPSLFHFMVVLVLWGRSCSAVGSCSSAMPTLPSLVASSLQAMVPNCLSCNIWRKRMSGCIESSSGRHFHSYPDGRSGRSRRSHREKWAVPSAPTGPHAHRNTTGSSHRIVSLLCPLDRQAAVTPHHVRPHPAVGSCDHSLNVRQLDHSSSSS